MSLIMAVVLPEVVGVKNFGINTFCVAMIQILFMLAMLDGQQLLIREIVDFRDCSGFFKHLSYVK